MVETWIFKSFTRAMEGEGVKISQIAALTGGTHSKKVLWIYGFADSEDISTPQSSRLLNSCLQGWLQEQSHKPLYGGCPVHPSADLQTEQRSVAKGAGRGAQHTRGLRCWDLFCLQWAQKQLLGCIILRAQVELPTSYSPCPEHRPPPQQRTPTRFRQKVFVFLFLAAFR